MIGAIIGDIVGSIYEWDNIKTKEFPLFKPNCFFTDDSILTIAVADAIEKGGTKEDFIKSIKAYGRKYPNAGYGSNFRKWLLSDQEEPYNSYGNGSAMRVSAVAFKYKSLNAVEKVAKISAEITHNHPEGIKGAQATAACIFLARNDYSKKAIKEYIEKTYGYDLDKSLEDIRPNYSFNVSCQGTVPEAIIAFLESKDFEDAIRNAISLGGDSDTLAAITGSIAEGAYGVPDAIKEKALSYLDEDLLKVVESFQLVT
jgi:ADP-ribosylglycohydrolase